MGFWFLEKIDYLQELGVNLVHIMPILKMSEGENDGGMQSWITDLLTRGSEIWRRSLNILVR